MVVAASLISDRHNAHLLAITITARSGGVKPLQRIVTFIAGLVLGLASMYLWAAREHAAPAPQPAPGSDIGAVRDEACRSLGYHHAEQLGTGWSCMDLDPDELEQGHEHDADHDDES
jgi:hypothetical protein